MGALAGLLHRGIITRSMDVLVNFSPSYVVI
jgi:hypothetical protein